jgi:hypothetical protein
VKTITTLLLAAFAVFNTRAQSISPTPSAKSRSGQFIVYSEPVSPLVAPKLATNITLVALDAVGISVSCERIKQAVLSELFAKDTWRGKVSIVLRHARSSDDEVVVNAIRFTDGWNYAVQMPDRVQPSRFVRAMTRVVLLEMANRNAPVSADLPAWLAEGMSELVITSSAVDLIVRPSHASPAIAFTLQTHETTNWFPLARAQQLLSTRQALTLEELSWSKPEEDKAIDVYRASAHLMVYELLRLKNGRAALRNFIVALPKRLNWQLTFLEAFRSDFPTQLDWEKWWALQTAHFAGRNLAQAWTTDDSWKKLDSILHPDVEVRVSANQFPMRADVSLQAIIREWDYVRQTQTLREKIRQLKDAQLRVAPYLLTLTTQYRQTLENYLQQMQKAGPLPVGTTQVRESVKKIIADTLKQLDALDAKAEALRTMPIASSEIDLQKTQ